MEDIVFGKKWFRKHQGKLLWLLNAPVIKYWFRWVLRIHKDVQFKVPIKEMGTSYFTIDAGLQYFKNSVLLKTYFENPDNTRETRRIAKKIYTKIRKGIIEDKEFLLPANTTDFRTHDKFSKRLFYAFKPFWYILHAFDWAMLDRVKILTRLSFGFSTLTQYPGSIGANNPVDGEVGKFDSHGTGAGDAWATIHDASSGDIIDYTSAIAEVALVYAGTTSNSWRNIYRSIFCFDTSALTAGVAVSAAVLSVYGGDTTKVNDSSWAATYNVYTSTPASTTSLTGTDYQAIGTTAQAAEITYANYSSSAYNDFTFNATGIGNVSLTGTSKFGIREATFDVANSPPTWTNSSKVLIYGYYSDQAGTTKDPKIVITYSLLSIPNQLIMKKQAVKRASFY